MSVQPTVPTIDISDFGGGTAATKDGIKREVLHALENVGFLVLTGHGVPEEKVESVVDGARRFFGEPTGEKSIYASSAAALNRGYFGVEQETLAIANENAGQRLPDLKEAFVIGRSSVSAQALALPGADTAYAPNIWPNKPVDLKAAMEAYYSEMSGLVFRLLRVFAYSLDLPEHYFQPMFEEHPSVMRVINYPARVEAPKPNQLRAAAHTDYGALTILKEGDATGGLQVRARSGEWIDIHSAPNSFVVNIGNVMKRWTNDRWTSNLHRVVNPTTTDGWKKNRISIPYFVHPRPDVVIECLSTCRDAGTPPRYSPIMASEFRMQQLKSATSAPASAAT